MESSGSSNIIDELVPGKARKSCKVVHFLRHAEGKQNIAGKFPGGYSLEENEDCGLTEFGQIQAQDIHEKLKAETVSLMPEAEIIVCSNMRRALQTASISFVHLTGSIPFVGLECVREQTGLNPCARRMPVSVHKTEYPVFDFDLIESENDAMWHKYTAMYPGGREPEADVVNRGLEFLDWLEKRNEKSLIVVTHASFLRMFFTQLIGVSVDDYRRFENCEMRSFLVSFYDDSPPSVVPLTAENIPPELA